MKIISRAAFEKYLQNQQQQTVIIFLSITIFFTSTARKQ